MERQSVGLKHGRSMMLLDNADTPAKWYFKLKPPTLRPTSTVVHSITR